jgi:putative acetyltransferase
LIKFRDETPADAPAIAALSREEFNGDYEADLIDRLREDGLVAVSLIAYDATDLVGHILFRELAVEIDGRSINAVALAPMAVRADRQRQGIGGQLIRHGLERLRQRGYAAVIVLGHPDYYPRFGFSAALAAKLRSPFPGEHFMALELEPDALAGQTGRVLYPPAFGL